MTLILGVDPGLSGAAAALDTTEWSVNVIDTPVLRLARGGKNRNEIDYYGMVRFLQECGEIDHAFIERVQSMPGQGVSSTFAFGRSTGVVIGAVAAHMISITEVAPRKWQNAMDIPVGAGKDAGRAMAMHLFPKQSDLFARVKDDGRADAVLIAVYGARTLGVRRPLARRT